MNKTFKFQTASQYNHTVPSSCLYSDNQTNEIEPNSIEHNNSNIFHPMHIKHRTFEQIYQKEGIL